MKSAPPSQPEDENRDPFEAVAEEFAEKIRNGGDPSIDSYLTKYPELADQIEELFPLIIQFEQPKLDTSVSDEMPVDSDRNRGKRTDDRAGETQTYTDLEDSAYSGLPNSDDIAFGSKDDQADDSSFSNDLVDPEPIERVGRYRIKRILGVGGFGRVYLAFDEQLHRSVAIKMPSDTVRERIDKNEFMREARIVAQLDHPAIVPVYDVEEDDGRVYIVSRFIQGMSLSDRIAKKPLTRHEAARIVEQIADGLHFAHSKGLVHRDIKPANILLDEDSTPFLTDFGIALSDQDLVESIRHAGTPRYMSPEQARGEGHLIDGRSDIFSLGIVLHELLTGVTPFRGKTPRDIMKRIVASRARPLRQFDATIPVELERICLRALAKHASDRYSTAFDFAEDLRAYLAESNPVDGSVFASPGTQSSHTTDRSHSTNTQISVMPKGLVAFDRNDADFFLQLLPGPFDRMGMPDSVRFWKHLIESRDPDAIRVGTVYGPSGCGKSSLIRAGVLPRLDSSIDSISLNGSASLCANLVSSIEKRWPELKSQPAAGDSDRSSEHLTNLCIQLRRDVAPRSGRKIVIVIDQFEQYLHANDDTQVLADALRQCDGVNVQTILMVRIDYWLGLSRFMQQLEPRQLDATNSRMVDLFDPRHARNVLKYFGRAYEALPASELSESQNRFLDEAIEQLQTDEKVVAVRLSLFAEMIKNRPWEPVTLKTLGGVEGIGIQFLDDSLGDRSSNPDIRLHRKALRETLSALMPRDLSELKGDVRSARELREACSYDNRPNDFETVCRILDTDLRLITPVVETHELDGEHDESRTGKSFQLSHDFLVPAIREWLTLQQRSTLAGRARLSLEEHARLWKRKPTNALLPKLTSYAAIRASVPKTVWSQDERTMMTRAGKYHFQRVATLAVGLAICLSAFFAIQAYWKRAQAESLAESFLSSSTTNIPVTLASLKPYLPLVQSSLESVDPADKPKHMRATLALLQTDVDRADDLARYLIETDDDTEFAVLAAELALHKNALLDVSWATLDDAQSSSSARLNAASAVAMVDDSDAGLKRLASYADSIVTPLIYGAANRATTLQPLGESLADGLWSYATDDRHDDQLRRKAVRLALEYSDTEHDVAFLLKASRTHLSQVMDHVAQNQDALQIIESKLPSLEDPRQVAIARLAAHRLGPFNLATPAFEYEHDPIVRSYYHSFVPLCGVDADPIFRRIQAESDSKILKGLIVAIAECKEFMSPQRATEVVECIKNQHRSNSDSGVHGACEYLMRKWHVPDWENKLAELQTTTPPTTDGSWYVNPLGQTFSVIRIRPFQQGSDPDFNPHYHVTTESLRRMDINRTIAISTTPITIRHYDAFQKVSGSPNAKELDLDAPVNHITWFNAAAYCNWLSEQEGIPQEEWCYEPRNGTYGKGMKFVVGSRKKLGYRLPTASEWEFACRSGNPPVMNRYYGTSDEILADYAWHGNEGGTVMPVGLRRPNEIGLFDMLGNVHEWTATHRAGSSGRRTIMALDEMIARGGSYMTIPKHVRDTSMYFEHARVGSKHQGFRIVRTLQPAEK